MRNWPFKIVDNSGLPLIQVRDCGIIKLITPEEILSLVLAKMKDIAESYLGKSFNQAVITCPADFNEVQRKATRDAAVIAGLHPVRLIDESTAVAMGYRKDGHIVVFDIGGGTVNVTLLLANGGVLHVLATAGNTHLGGEELDHNLVEHFATDFRTTFNKDLHCDSRALGMLRTACERAKITLSEKEEAIVEINDLLAGINYLGKITRSFFEQVNKQFFRSTVGLIDQVLQSQDPPVSKISICEVIMVGGSAQIPMIQKLVSELFDHRLQPNNIRNWEEAAAHGAAVQAAILSGAAKSSPCLNDILLLDVTPHSLGVEKPDTKVKVIVPKNKGFPFRIVGHIYTSNRSASVTIRVIQGRGICLGEFKLPLLPTNRDGEKLVLVTFNCDRYGMVDVTAESDTSRKVALNDLRIGLTREQIAAMKQEAYHLRREAEKRRHRAQARLEENVHQTKQTCDEILTWLTSNPKAPKEKIEEREAQLFHCFEALLKKNKAEEEANRIPEMPDVARGALPAPAPHPQPPQTPQQRIPQATIIID
ncbi:heat-shock protein 70 [Pelomyxa schiedti]|nr:heat-shock protein 70 [Pelomyxa schiedti]